MIFINGRGVGIGLPPYIIAEMSGNHNGSLHRAVELIAVAREAGADAVKLQTYTPETMTIDHDSPDFIVQGGPWKGRRLYELYQEVHTPWDWQERLFQYGRTLGITVFSSVFDETSVDFLEGLDAPAYKIASFEIVDLPLIRRCARTGKPLILSTGMADMEEVQEAVIAAGEAGCRELLLLHCVSSYPASAEEYNLRTIGRMSEAFGIPAGLSDHTLGIAVPVAAVALGACAVEKHFTMTRSEGGPDAAFSLEPDELKNMIEACNAAYAAVDGRQSVGTEDAIQLRRSLYAVRDIGKGEMFTSENVRSIRPGYGVAPKYLELFMGHQSSRDIARGTAISWEHLSCGG